MLTFLIILIEAFKVPCSQAKSKTLAPVHELVRAEKSYAGRGLAIDD